MPRWEWVYESFGGSLMRRRKQVETLREEMARCRAADAERISSGKQEQFLQAQVAATLRQMYEEQAEQKKSRRRR